MDHSSVEQRVLILLRERFADQPIDIAPDTRLFELGDSLERVEAIMEVEDEFELSIPDDTANGFHTLADMIDYIVRHAGSGRPSATTSASANSDADDSPA